MFRLLLHTHSSLMLVMLAAVRLLSPQLAAPEQEPSLGILQSLSVSSMLSPITWILQVFPQMRALAVVVPLGPTCSRTGSSCTGAPVTRCWRAGPPTAASAPPSACSC